MTYHRLFAPFIAVLLGCFAPVADVSAAESASFNWSGFYAGGNAGYVWGASKFGWQPGPTFSDPNNLLPIVLGNANATLHPSGLIGGATAGYNYQAGGIVWGIEADFDFSNADKSRFVNLSPILGSPPGNTIYESAKIEWLATLRPRVGVLTGGGLFFVTGGLAVGQVEYSTVHGYAAVPPGAGSTSSPRAGWTAGAGFECALSTRWTAKAEYLYVDLGSVSFSEWSSFGLPADSFMSHRQSTAMNIVRLGLNYRFGN